MKKTDQEQLSTIYLESRKLTFNWITPSTFALDDFARDTEGEEIFVAEENGKVCGFVSVWMPDNFIHHLFISSEFARRGIGVALLKHAIAHTGTPARLKCVVRNENACRFYEANGWKIESSSEDVMGPYHTYVFGGDKIN